MSQWSTATDWALYLLNQSSVRTAQRLRLGYRAEQAWATHQESCSEQAPWRAR